MNIREVNIKEYKLISRGKVRDIYDLEDSLLFIATDRISAFDQIMHETIPNKGFILNQISKFWFEKTSGVVENHFITDNPSSIHKNLEKYSDFIDGRSMLVRKADVIPFECIVRGYISGSAWEEYKKSKTVNGESIDYKLLESEQFREPIFTPSTKAKTGHDINVSFEYMKNKIGKEITEKVKKYSLDLYKYGFEYALQKDIIIADTKFEFGIVDNKIILIDEILTPDSSRFWPLNSHVPGNNMIGLDKQFLRNYLTNVNWIKNSSPPHLPESVVNKISERYISIYSTLTGKNI
ncbi:phosphoribosylaminoimidazolesuccinocarboxamide synthase [candidate division WOR-3 bacterium]|nr:phosphoribosylaminoimidazolesuccinocarboxamide synthase [candidate division WOR-3 bacterium]